MKVVEQSVKLGQVESIRFLLNATLNYSMCCYTGNRATFNGYLDTQMNSLIDVKATSSGSPSTTLLVFCLAAIPLLVGGNGRQRKRKAENPTNRVVPLEDSTPHTMLGCNGAISSLSHSTVTDVLRHLHNAGIRTNIKHLSAGRQLRKRVLRDGQYSLDFEASRQLTRKLEQEGVTKRLGDLVEVPEDSNKCIIYYGILSEEEVTIMYLMKTAAVIVKRKSTIGTRVLFNCYVIKKESPDGSVRNYYLNDMRKDEFKTDFEAIKPLVAPSSRAMVRRVLHNTEGPALWPRNT